MGKRGPNTPESKAAVRHNAVKHGLTSDAPVIPGESLAEWQRFLAGIIAGYEPVGRLETEHATMIASLMWRRRRVARFEVAVITANMERTEGDLQVAQAYGAGTLSKGPLPPFLPRQSPGTSSAASFPRPRTSTRS